MKVILPNKATKPKAISGRAGQSHQVSLPIWLIACLLILTLLPGLSQAAGQAPIKTGPGAPIFTLGDPAYQGISNAQGNVSANAPAGAAGNLTGMVNHPPVIGWATAANTVVTAPASFALSVNASDPDGTVAKVDYYNGTALIGTATAAPYGLTWSSIAAGTYTLTAVATDNLGMSATTGAITVISNAPPTASLTAPAANTVQTAPATFTLSATAADSDGTIAKIDYYANTTLIGTATAAPYSIDWTNVPAGTYAITAKATDGYGISNSSAPISVISNAPPTVSLTAPTTNSSYTTPANIALAADATDSDGPIARVEFYNGTTLIGTTTTAPYSFTWNNAPVGTYTITAVAADSFGTSATSAAVVVTVKTGVAQVYYIHTDHLDTPRQITDTAGNVVWEWQNLDPFGNNEPNENPSGQGTFEFPLRFKGQTHDKETGLNQNYFRDYDPATGTYKEFDLIGLRGGINGFTYVRNNPLSAVDPLGLIDLKIPGATGQTSIRANPGPDATDYMPDHDPPHVHLGTNDGPRVDVENFEPLSEKDAKDMTKEQKKMCKNLSEDNKNLIRKRQQNVYKLGSAILKGLTGPMMLTPFAYCQADVGRCIDTIESIQDSLNDAQ